MKLENILPYKLNLQFFAEPGEGDNPGADKNPSGEGEEGKPEVLELTPEELQRKIDSEADRRLDKVLKKKQQEWESELQQRIDEAIKEQQRLSKLSEKERKEEEIRKREEELEKRLKELERKELKADAIGVLNEKELPTSFVDFLLADDAESTLANINAFKEAFDNAVAEKVKEALAGKPPKKNPTHTVGITKEQFEKMGYSERIKLYNENPELYEQLSK